MLWINALLAFYLELFRLSMLPQSCHDCSPNADDPHRRRFTRDYLRRKGLVKNLWLLTVGSWLAFPVAPYLAATGLFTTMVAFAILDEH